jgi:hypothetical protein
MQMQFQAVLCNRQHPEYGVATIPFPIPGTEYENVIRLLEPLGLGDEVKQDCHIEEIRGDIPALKQIERTNANLDELDYLAKRLDSFDAYELTQFQGMASRLSLHSVERVINLTFCCQESTVISDFTHLDAIGRKHFLTLNGGCASKCKAGMSKEVIQSMYEYDCDTFLSERRYRDAYTAASSRVHH